MSKILYPVKAALDTLNTYAPVYEACMQSEHSHVQARLHSAGIIIKVRALIAHDRVLCGTVRRGRG